MFISRTTQLLLFGANDACLPSSPTLQHVPLERYRENIKKIITHPAITAHKPTILLVTPPPINEVHLESEDLQKGRALTRHQRVTSQYASTIREIAAEFKSPDVILVDIWTALMKQAARLTPGYVEGQGLLGTKELGDNERLRSLLIDGLHLTGAAYKIFLGEVLPLVGPEWESEPLDFPSWIFP
jgi:isoamyl acetate esterase